MRRYKKKTVSPKIHHACPGARINTLPPILTIGFTVRLELQLGRLLLVHGLHGGLFLGLLRGDGILPLVVVSLQSHEALRLVLVVLRTVVHGLLVVVHELVGVFVGVGGSDVHTVHAVGHAVGHAAVHHVTVTSIHHHGLGVVIDLAVQNRDLLGGQAGVVNLVPVHVVHVHLGPTALQAGGAAGGHR